MNRRRFLEALAALGAGAALARCGAMVSPARDDDGGTPRDATSPDASLRDATPSDARVERDASLADAAPDRPPPAVVTGDMVEILVAMSVLLEDVSCSGHNHGFSVSPRRVRRDEILAFLDGSHRVEFSGDELARIARGERVPFATTGNSAGHGHCGLAFLPSLGATMPRPVAECRPRNAMAICIVQR